MLHTDNMSQILKKGILAHLVTFPWQQVLLILSDSLEFQVTLNIIKY